MTVRTRFFLLAFLCLVTITNQLFTKTNIDSSETTLENSTFDRAVGKVKSLLDLNNKDTSSSDSSSSDSSDNNNEKDSKLGFLLEGAKNTSDRVSEDLRVAKETAKREAKKAWKKLREEIIAEADASNTSIEELNARLRDAKKDLKRKAIENWKNLRNKTSGPNLRANESSESSSDTSDDQPSKISALLGSATDVKNKVSQEYKERKKIMKKEAKKAWKELKANITSEANATDTSAEELKARLKSAKKDFKRKAKESWKAFMKKASELNATMTDGMPNA